MNMIDEEAPVLPPGFRNAAVSLCRCELGFYGLFEPRVGILLQELLRAGYNLVSP